jgi:ABC-type amino acid transport substrate-binding protein
MMNFTRTMFPTFRQFAHIAVVCLVGLTSAGAVNAESLKVGYFDLPPHAFTDKAGASAGSAVEFFKAVAQKMGVKDVSFQQLPLSRLVVVLESGEIDAALFIGQNPERAAKFYYPSKPYYMAQPGLVIASGSAITAIKSADDLKPLKIGIMQGGLLSAAMRTPGLNIDPMSGGDADTRNIQKLTSGRLDAAYSADMGVLVSIAKGTGADKTVRAVALPDPANPIFTIFNKAKGAALGAKYVEALDAVVKEKGEYGKAFLK